MRTYKIYYLVGDTVKFKSYSHRDFEINYDIQTGLIQIYKRDSQGLYALWSPHNYVYMEVLR